MDIPKEFWSSRWWQETGELQDKSQQNEEMGLVLWQVGDEGNWGPTIWSQDSPPSNDVLVFGGPVIKFSHPFWESCLTEVLEVNSMFLVMDFGGWGWLDDWVYEWKICWETAAVRMWSVTSWFSCGPSLLALCYQKHPTAVLVHIDRYSQSL